MDPAIASARGRLADASFRRPHEDHSDIRRELAAAKIAACIRRVLAEAPALTSEQCDRIAAILRGGGAP
ncbi:hypothetical protein C3477_06820 [Mycobacterium kansasii]|nr:hypothetical protein C3B43_06550 [Mycobacterium kansasii]POY07672.1 hypothetical protein C3477_06820 [Mycobacterium kansasii]POY22652.1 hypothetical protein C3476_10400 [Mycobacterium kansasii]